MRQVRFTPQACKDLKAFDDRISDQIKDALRHLAEHPLEGKPLKGQFKKDKVWSYWIWPYAEFFFAVSVPNGSMSFS